MNTASLQTPHPSPPVLSTQSFYTTQLGHTTLLQELTLFTEAEGSYTTTPSKRQWGIVLVSWEGTGGGSSCSQSLDQGKLPLIAVLDS